MPPDAARAASGGAGAHPAAGGDLPLRVLAMVARPVELGPLDVDRRSGDFMTPSPDRQTQGSYR